MLLRNNSFDSDLVDRIKGGDDSDLVDRIKGGDDSDLVDRIKGGDDSDLVDLRTIVGDFLESNVLTVPLTNLCTDELSFPGLLTPTGADSFFTGIAYEGPVKLIGLMAGPLSSPSITLPPCLVRLQ
jgi:hypothetical protein